MGRSSIGTLVALAITAVALHAEYAGPIHAQDEPLAWSLSLDPGLYQIRDLTTYAGDLYATGHSLGGAGGPLLRYDGISWSPIDLAAALGVPILGVPLAVFGGDLFIGARVFENGAYWASVVRFDGVSFIREMTDAGTEGYSGMEALAVHDGVLYAGNGTLNSRVYRRISPGSWVTVGGILDAGSPVRALASYDGSLYAGTGAHWDRPRVWRWTGSTWDLVVDFTTEFGATQMGTWSLAVHDGTMYAALAGPGASTVVYSFDGTLWSPNLLINGCPEARVDVVGDEVWAISMGAVCGFHMYRRGTGGWVDVGASPAGAGFTVAQYGGDVYLGTYSPGRIYVVNGGQGLAIPHQVVPSHTDGAVKASRSYRLYGGAGATDGGVTTFGAVHELSPGFWAMYRRLRQLPSEVRGDCNGDASVDAGDISAVILEVFDADGDVPERTGGGTFAGRSFGCDANGDGALNAGDLSCVIVTIFSGPGACGP